MPRSQPDSSASEPDQQPVLFEESVSLDDLVLQSQQQQEPDGAELPCAINGLTSGLSGGVLGYAFGFVPKVATHRGAGRWAASKQAGWESAKTFAILGGLYTFVSCFMKRLRMKDDPINNGMAGCATGVALGWKGGPMSAAQSCVGFGLFSVVFDYLGGGAAQALSFSQSQARRVFSTTVQFVWTHIGKVLLPLSNVKALPVRRRVKDSFGRISQRRGP